MPFRMPRSTAETLKLIARASPEEQCGFVLENGAIRPIKNAAYPHERQISFRFDPEEQKEFAKANPSPIIGVYHTHPGGTRRPSTSDLEGWPQSIVGHCQYWIATGSVVVEWSYKDGELSQVDVQ